LKKNGKNGDDGQDWFDFEESKRRRDEGMDRVRDNNRVWFDASVLASTQLVKDNPAREFLGEDFRHHCQRVVGPPKTPKAWGALTRELIKNGWIKPTGEHRPMRAKRSHARQTPVYKGAASHE